MRVENEIAAIERVEKFMEPYARVNRRITFGKALTMAYAALKPDIESSVKPPWVRIDLERRWPPYVVQEVDSIGLLAVCPVWRPEPIWSPSTKRFHVIHRPSDMEVLSGFGWEKSMKIAEEMSWLDWTLTGSTVAQETLDKAWVILNALRFGVTKPKKKGKG